MTADVVLLPKDLTPALLADRAVVVFDVLRATTTMTAALAAGVPRIFVFDNIEAAREGAARGPARRLLVGEVNALRPPGFDLGNSPGEFSTERHAGIDVYMSTTNGTRAIFAARSAPVMFVAALVNRTAAAKAAAAEGRDVTLLCAGTQGQLSKEDLLGAGAVFDALVTLAGCAPATDAARVAHDLFRAAKDHLPATLRDTTGGHNVIRAGLQPDVDFAARTDAFDLVGRVDTTSLVVTPYRPSN